MAHLEINSLSFGYEKQNPIIKNISFEINKGEFVSIIGPNGAGKSTLFKLMTAFIKPWSGSVLIESKEVNSFTRKEFAKVVAILPQSFDLYFPFTVLEFVSMGRFPYTSRIEPLNAHDREVIDNAMKLTQIETLGGRLISELSGGERQRVLLAQALAQDPQILLLDEPTTHLDIAHQVEVLDLAKELNKKKGITVIAVLHDLNLASEYSERILLMDKGTINLFSTPEKVLTYENIEKVYKTVVIVKNNPVSNKPHIFLVSKSAISIK